MKALDFMIENNIFEYCCDLWSRQPKIDHYYSVEKVENQINYKGEIFIIKHQSGNHGSGGMSEGSPPSVSIIRIKK